VLLDVGGALLVGFLDGVAMDGVTCCDPVWVFDGGDIGG